MSSKSTISNSRQKVLGYPIDVLDETSAIGRVEQALGSARGMHVVTLNAEMVIQAQRDQRLDRIIRHAHLIVPDGAGAVWALKLDGHRAMRLPGIDLAQKALTAAARLGIRVALVGGKAEVVEQLVTQLPKDYPGLNIVYHHHGYISEEQEEGVVESLAAQQPGLVLVAMGVPRQEHFIDSWQNTFPGAVVIGVGGSFDVWTGSVKRAPIFFQKMSLEWLYRLIKEPWRFSRMASSLPSFAIQVLVRRYLGAEKVHGSSDEHGSGMRIPWRRVKKKSRSQDHMRERSERSTDTWE